MRHEHPKAEMHASGVWGGFATAPGHEAWTPGGEHVPAAPERVPRRFRRLRLHRTRPRPSALGDGSAWPALLVFGIVVIPLVLVVGRFLLGMLGLDF